LKIFGLSDTFLRTYYSEIEFHDKDIEKFMYHENSSSRYYLIRPIKNIIFRKQFGTENYIIEPTMSGSVWKLFKNSRKLLSAINRLLKGPTIVTEFNVMSTTTANIFQDEKAVFQLLWHFGMVIRERYELGKFNIRLTWLIRGDTLDNYMKEELVSSMEIPFDEYLRNEKWQLLIDLVFNEFNRTLSAFDFPLTAKLGVIESTISLAFSILPGRSSHYEIHPQSSNPGGLADFLAISKRTDLHHSNVLELKVPFVSDLLSLYSSNFDEFHNNLKDKMTCKAAAALEDTYTKQYVNSTLLAQDNEVAVMAFVFCRTLCTLAVQKYIRVKKSSQFKRSEGIQYFYPQKQSILCFKKIHKVLNRKKCVKKPQDLSKTRKK